MQIKTKNHFECKIEYAVRKLRVIFIFFHCSNFCYICTFFRIYVPLVEKNKEKTTSIWQSLEVEAHAGLLSWMSCCLNECKRITDSSSYFAVHFIVISGSEKGYTGVVTGAGATREVRGRGVVEGHIHGWRHHIQLTTYNSMPLQTYGGHDIAGVSTCYHLHVG